MVCDERLHRRPGTPLSPNTHTAFVIEQAPAFDIVFITTSAAFLVIGIAWSQTGWSKTLRRNSVLVFGFGAFWIVFSALLLGLGTWSLLVQQAQRYSAYTHGKYYVLAGCLQGFSPSSDGHQPDRIRIDGHVFTYADAMENGGFHEIAMYGGPIQSDTWVRLFVIKDGGFDDLIARVDVAEHVCPAAPPVVQ
jgi:hypothetical protein